jgi:hypothetical protein
MARLPASNPEEARRRAEARFAKTKQRDQDAQTAYEELAKHQRAEAAKTERLRALRLAKEAAEAEVAARAAAAKAQASATAQERRTAKLKSAKSKPELV